MSETTNLKSWDNYSFDLKFDGEINTLPSQTLPDQSMSLQDLVNKFTVDSVWPKEPLPEQFDNEETFDLPEYQKMSTIEKTEELFKLKQNIEEQRKNLEQLHFENQNQNQQTETTADSPQSEATGASEEKES